MVSTIESPKAAITYDDLFGEGFTEGFGVGLGLGEGVGVGARETTTAVLTSPFTSCCGLGFISGELFEEKNTQPKMEIPANIKTTIINLIRFWFFDLFRDFS